MSLMMVCFAAVLVVSGCSLPFASSGVALDEIRSDVTITAPLQALGASEGWTASITFSRSRHSFTETVAVTDQSLAATMEVPAGTWDISLVLKDETGTPNYQDTVEGVTIYPDRPSTISFELRPADGTVSVAILLTGFPYQDEVLRVRVHFNDTVEEIQRDEPSEPLAAEYQLPPGSYDFKAELFTESFRATDQVDPGVWKVIHVEPLAELDIQWIPFIEELALEASIELVAEAPTALHAVLEGNSVELQWEPSPSTDILGYYVLWQPDPFERFEIVGELPPDAVSYSHSLDDHEDSLEYPVRYAVAAYSTQGPGYRSEMVSVDIP